MGQLALAGIGAGASSLLGIGPAPGWIVGSIVGGLLFPDRPEKGSPQIGDRSIQSASYGTPITVGYGTVRVAGNVIWATPIEVVSSAVLAGGMGGGLGALEDGGDLVAVSSFAVGLARGPATSVLKIWADGNIIYDAGSDAGNLESFGGQPLRFRFYPGDEEQLADPAIEADQGTSVPAFRGLCYVLFESMDLSPFGNRIPSITAELGFSVAQGTAVTVMDPLDNPPITAADVDPDNIGLCWDAGLAFVMTGGNVMRKIDLGLMRELTQVELDDVIDGPLTSSRYSPLLVADTGSTDYRPINLIGEIGLIDTFGTTGSGSTNTINQFVNTVSSCFLRLVFAQGQDDLILCAGPNGQLGILAVDAIVLPGQTQRKELAYVWGENESLGTACRVVTAAPVADTVSTAWLLTQDMLLYRMTITRRSAGPRPGGAQIPVVTVDQVADFSSLGSSAGLWHDDTDSGALVLSTTGGLGKYVHGVGVVYERSAVVPALDAKPDSHGHSVVSIGRLALVADGDIWLIDTLRGTAQVVDAAPGSVTGFESYHAPTNSLIVFADGVMQRWALQRQGAAAVTIQSVLEGLSASAGLESTEVDASGIPGTVRGYAVSRGSSAKDAIDPLLSVFRAAAHDNAGILSFVLRGGGADLGTVTEDEFILEGDGAEVYREERVEQVDLPRSVEVTYLDAARDYQAGAQRAQRAVAPLPVVSDGEEVELSVPVAISADEARAAAEAILYQAWQERVSFSLTLPRPWLRAQPTDLLTLSLGDGRVIETRVVRATVLPSYSVALDLLAQEGAVFEGSGAAGDSGNTPESPSPGSPPTQALAPDIPLVRDEDDIGRIASRAYFILAGFGQSGWPGGRLYRSFDGGTSFGVAGSSNEEGTIGFAASILPAPVMIFATDYINTVDVLIQTGDAPTSITHEQMLAGGNIALLGEELIQFADVEVLGDGLYRLSTLLRGRRGTDPFVGTHAIGEPFALLQGPALRRYTNPLQALSLTHLFRAAGIGQNPLTGTQSAGVVVGADLLPYAPVHIYSEDDGASGINIFWTRRTRVGGEWLDDTGTVPLAEDIEEYAIEIRETAVDPVLRTVNTTVPEYNYTAAQILEDLGVERDDTVHITVYQLSAQVGRGRAGAANVVLNF